MSIAKTDKRVSSKPGRPSSKPIRAPARSAAQSRTYAVLWGRELLIGDEEACPVKTQQRTTTFFPPWAFHWPRS